MDETENASTVFVQIIIAQLGIFVQVSVTNKKMNTKILANLHFFRAYSCARWENVDLMEHKMNFLKIASW